MLIQSPGEVHITSIASFTRLIVNETMSCVYGNIMCHFSLFHSSIKGDQGRIFSKKKRRGFL